MYGTSPGMEMQKKALTGYQCRAARAILRWTAQDLADQAGLSLPTIQRIETFDGDPSASAATLAAVKGALEAQGVKFKAGAWNIGPAIAAPALRLLREQEKALNEKKS